VTRQRSLPWPDQGTGGGDKPAAPVVAPVPAAAVALCPACDPTIAFQAGLGPCAEHAHLVVADEATEVYRAERRTERSVDHGVADDRGRAVGGEIWIEPELASIAGNAWLPTGRWLWQVQATRAGKSFGASQRSHREPSEEAAKKNAAATVARQRSRSRKQWAKKI